MASCHFSEGYRVMRIMDEKFPHFSPKLHTIPTKNRSKAYSL